MTTTSICPRCKLRSFAAVAASIALAIALSAMLGVGQSHASELKASTSITVKTQAAAKGSTYALLAKDGYLYPCNSKGKKLAKAWDAYSANKVYRVTKLFVAANATKVPNKARYREYYKYSRKTGKRSYSLSSLGKMKNVTFLTKAGKSSCKSIAASAFSYRSSLKTLTNFGKTRVTSIGKSAFSHSGLKKVSLPSTLKTIGNSAFSTCKSLKTVSGLEKTRITSVSDYAFYRCAIKSIAFPNTLKSIGTWAFSDCNALTSVTLPATTTKLGDGAFQNCSALSTLTMKSASMVTRSDGVAGKMDYVIKGAKVADTNTSSAAYIYVPASLLASYQADSITNPWRTYRTKFRAIV